MVTHCSDSTPDGRLRVRAAQVSVARALGSFFRLGSGVIAVTTILSAGCRDSTSPPPTGAIRVTVTTTGVEVDPDGYRASLDGGLFRDLSVNDGFTFASYPVGDHSVRLEGLARNCVVNGTNPRPVTVVRDETVVAEFSVTCLAVSGDIHVSTATTGVDLDPDGYRVSVNRTDQAIATNGTVTVPRLPAGNYLVTLRAVAGNCDITGPHPRTVAVAAGATTVITFEVTCAPVTPLAIVKRTNGNADIWTINSNGTGGIRLTTHAAPDVEPAWSPDGSKIAFRSDRDGSGEIYAMTADGSGVTRLTQHAALDTRPTWSPDGRRIAFQSGRDGNDEIYVMNADGSGVTRLSSNDGSDRQPAWSPDGQKIAFASDRDGNFEIYVMNADGSAATRLTTHATDDVQPAWSPDGSRVAFTRFAGCDYYGYGCSNDIYVINVTGLGVTPLIVGWEDHTEPAWSPDGRKIAVTLTVCFYYSHCDDASSSVMVARTDGTNVTDVTNGSASSPSWRR
jgi:WD40 repeat protein